MARRRSTAVAGRNSLHPDRFRRASMIPSVRALSRAWRVRAATSPASAFLNIPWSENRWNYSSNWHRALIALPSCSIRRPRRTDTVFLRSFETVPPLEAAGDQGNSPSALKPISNSALAPNRARARRRPDRSARHLYCRCIGDLIIRTRCTASRPRDLSAIAQFVRERRPDRLRTGHHGYASSAAASYVDRILRGAKPGRPTGAGADTSSNWSSTSTPLQGARHRGAADPARPRRRGDRVRDDGISSRCSAARRVPCGRGLRAQPQPRMLRVGFVGVQPRESPFYGAFLERMAELGYQEGRNFTFEYIQTPNVEGSRDKLSRGRGAQGRRVPGSGKRASAAGRPLGRRGRAPSPFWPSISILWRRDM